jgi:sulfate adenylyltransferase subunit 1
MAGANSINAPLDTSIDTLRFSTAGSVDDGKSTLIGRLLFDAHGILEDQLANLAGATAKHGHVGPGEPIDFSLLTDGLIAEREQGITIDVAYRYFATPKRRFIVADTPGHEQYTRNMVTGASTADLTVILVDASRDLTVQSRRHAVIAGLLKIPHVVIAVNKMDLVGYREERFNELKSAFLPFVEQLGFGQISVVPISALKGEMLALRGAAMPWYEGPTLLDILETSDAHLRQHHAFRFPVQRVSKGKFGAAADLRGYQGLIEGGEIRAGSEVVVLPSGATAKVAEVRDFLGAVAAGHEGQSLTVVLDRQLDISRGDMLVAPGTATATTSFTADMCWLDASPLDLNRRYWLKHTTRMTRAVVEKIHYRVDVSTLAPMSSADASVGMNDVVRVELSTQQPIVAEAYGENRRTGSFILIDDATNRTIAAGMITETAA